MAGRGESCTSWLSAAPSFLVSRLKMLLCFHDMMENSSDAHLKKEAQPTSRLAGALLLSLVHPNPSHWHEDVMLGGH